MDAAKSKEQQVFGGSSKHQRERFKTQKAPVGNVPRPKTKHNRLHREISQAQTETQQCPKHRQKHGNVPSTDRNTTGPNGKGPNTERNTTCPYGKCPKNREKQNRPLREMS